MDDDRYRGATTGATILNFPTPGTGMPRETGDLIVGRDPMAGDPGEAAPDMATMQATVINLLLQQMRRLHQVLPQVVDGLIRQPESELIARYWAEAADGQDQILSTVMDVLGKTALPPISPDMYASTDRSVMRLRSLIAECRRRPEERAVLFGSASHLRRRVLEEMAILERNMTALDAAARKAAGLD